MGGCKTGMREMSFKEYPIVELDIVYSLHIQEAKLFLLKSHL